MLFCFTHDIEIDWMLPGVAPTGRYVEIPLVAIVCFQGDKLYHEHIYWGPSIGYWSRLENWIRTACL